MQWFTDRRRTDRVEAVPPVEQRGNPVGEAAPQRAHADRAQERAYPAPVEATGNPEVDAVLSSLSGVTAAPPAQQLARYAAAHQALAETLRTIDAA